MDFLKKLSSTFLKHAIRQNKILTNRVKLIRAMQKALANVKEPIDRTHLQDTIEDIRNDSFGHNLSISLKDPKQITFVNRKEDLTLPLEKRENKRQKTTLAKYLKRNYTSINRFADDVLRDFCAEVLALITSSEELSAGIQELEGDDIVNYYATTDQIAHSCMTGECEEGEAPLTGLYALNPNKVKLITFANKARALLWTTDDGTKVLDRVYPAASKEMVLLRKWAEDQGYVLRSNPDGLETGTVKLSDGEEHRITMKHNGVFPYLDTFHFGELNEDNNTVELSNYETFGDVAFMELNGTYSSSHNECENCGDRISRNDDRHRVDGNDYCNDCYSQAFFECHKCGDVEKIDEGLSDDENYFCQDCFYKIYFHCQNCSEATFNEDGVIVNKNEKYDEGYYCRDCVEKSCTQCEHCARWFTKRYIRTVYDLYNGQKDFCYLDTDAKQCKECSDYYNYELKDQKCINCNPSAYEPNDLLGGLEAQYDYYVNLLKNGNKFTNKA
jgi:hypothetical protein